MRIFIICSKQFYGRLPEIQFELEAMGHTVVLPNCHDAPETEELNREKGKDVHAQWKKEKDIETFNKTITQRISFIF